MAEAARVQHRPGGRGAEQDHPGIGHGVVLPGAEGHARVQRAQGVGTLALGLQAGGVHADALPGPQRQAMADVRAGHGAAADDGQLGGIGRGQGIHRQRRGGGGALGGKGGGVAEQQRLAVLHGHQQGPGGDHRPLRFGQVGRGLDPVDLLAGQYAEVVDEVTASGERHQLLGRLHGLSGGEVEEHAAQGGLDVDQGQQAFGFVGGDDPGQGAGHGGTPL